MSYHKYTQLSRQNLVIAFNEAELTQRNPKIRIIQSNN